MQKHRCCCSSSTLRCHPNTLEKDGKLPRRICRAGTKTASTRVCAKKSTASVLVEGEKRNSGEGHIVDEEMLCSRKKCFFQSWGDAFPLTLHRVIRKRSLLVCCSGGGVRSDVSARHQSFCLRFHSRERERAKALPCLRSAHTS